MENIKRSMDFVQNLLIKRIDSFFSNSEKELDFKTITLPKLKKEDSKFWHFVKENKLSSEEFVTLMVALIPHLDPSFLVNIISRKLPQASDFNEIGGIKSKDNRYFLPTGETVLFLLGGSDVLQKSKFRYLFSSDHLFSKKGILHLDRVKSGIPKTTGQLLLDEEFVDLFVMGKENLPQLSIDFPATHLTTDLDWSDLVLPVHTMKEIEEIKNWVMYNATLMDDWGMAKKLKPGFRALFHGPSGTGKTMTATLLGKETGLEVFRIDLSMVISKYIGETEKNLSSLFKKAENKNWILFFDEADALFGKRTLTQSSNDRYANQEVSYLLQRIENHPGVIILASNFKGNMDPAFTRRFQSFVLFNIPNAHDRFKIWQNAFPKKAKLDKSVDLMAIAESFELSGSSIMNVVQNACLNVLARKSNLIKRQDILAGIRKEFSKEGKMI